MKRVTIKRRSNGVLIAEKLMAIAKSVRQVLRAKLDEFEFEDEWREAFSRPQRQGVWFIWGNSGNGKTSFVMQLAKELCKYGVVAYNSLEEGDGTTMQKALERYGMIEVNSRFVLIPGESMEELSKRLKKWKSPNYIIIDSFQYTQMTYKEYIAFKESHRDKLLIFISHADGKQPTGRSARSVMYDASLKIWVEGYRAFSKGRFIGNKGTFDIWPEGAAKYWREEL